MKQITLYRPVGQKELDLIRATGSKRFPPRLEWQPIFYPVMNQAYAEQIAFEWNTHDEFSGFAGHVTAFELPEEYLQQFPVHNVGGELHNELWIPSGQLEEFNQKIIGEIRLIKSYFGDKYKAAKKNKMEKQLKHLSKLMSLVLRHQPEAIGLQLDENGWADVEQLIKKINSSGTTIDISLLKKVVADNDKQRFAFNEDETKIRASQGHSIQIDLALQPLPAPDVLYHGTAERFLSSILKDGLSKQQRQHVHLSSDPETARPVGSRHGKPVILKIDSMTMQKDGILFFLSENKVWLVEKVPVKYISL